MNKRDEFIEPGLYRLTRESGAVVWIAMANGINYLSYSEAGARSWLAVKRGGGPEAA